MTRDEVRNIIRDELSNILKIDRIVFDKNVQILDARNIQLGRTTGTQLGTASDQKLKLNCMLGFFNTAPVDQPEFIADPSGGAVVDSQARTAIGTIIDRMIELGIIKSS